jgi:hypothetical protein
VSIEIVDLQDFVLSTYDRRIAEYATAQFRRQNIKLHLCVACGATLRAGVLRGAITLLPVHRWHLRRRTAC